MVLHWEEVRRGELTIWFGELATQANESFERNERFKAAMRQAEFNFNLAPRYIGIDPANILNGDHATAVTGEYNNGVFTLERIEHLTQEIIRSNVESNKAREKAEARAKDLFKLVAGDDAFYKMNTGGLQVKGSAGGEYVLHPRMTYCVERPKDKAKLCAVVPNVPMWDHLLGIKLMIENDEPAFLKTANVSAPGLNLAGQHFARQLSEEFMRTSRFGPMFNRW